MRGETLGHIETKYSSALEKNLSKIGVIPSSQKIVSAKRIFDSGMCSESWLYGYEITTQDNDGNKSAYSILERNVISTGGFLSERANKFVNRLNHINSLGVPTPHTFGVVEATIYQEYIKDEGANKRLTEMRNEGSSDELDQLINMGATLHLNGYRGDIRDVYYDPSKSLFLYGDVGNDLDIPKPPHSFINSLADRLKNQKNYIFDKYESTLNSVLAS